MASRPQSTKIRAKRIALSYWDAGGGLSRIEETIVKIDAHRVEIRLGESSIVVPFGEVAAARRLVGDDLLIGLSTHSPQQVDAARQADYIAVGPVYATPTKPEDRR